MVKGRQATREAAFDQAPTASKVLSHPMRVRILEVVNEQEMSPVQFLNSALAPDFPPDMDFAARLAKVAYHFRELGKVGCVVVAKTVQRRGATEHIYRGAARAYFTDEEWAKLDRDTRRRISRTVLQGLVARAESAMIEGQFDARLDRHLSWTPVHDLDERGWDDLNSTLARTLADVEQIRTDSARRLDESGGHSFTATVGLLLFESPPSQPAATLAIDDAPGS